MLFRIQVFQGPVFQGPCFPGSPFFRGQVFQGPGFSWSRFFRVRVQVVEVAEINRLISKEMYVLLFDVFSGRLV